MRHRKKTIKLGRTSEHRDALLAQMCASAPGEVVQHRHVGLGNLPPNLLRRACVDPATRAARQVGQEDVEAVLAVFGAGT